MRIMIAAVAAFVLSGLNLLPISAKTLPAVFEQYRDVGLTLLTLYIVLESVLLLRGRKAVLLPTAQPQPRPEPAAPPSDKPSQPGEALVFLSLMQQKGRLLDFLMEDITAFQDAQVAAASRVVHQGCSAVIKEYFDISPVHTGKEGDRITIDPSSDPNQYRLIGKMPGQPPFTGMVVHRGWKTSKITLPRFTGTRDAASRNIIAPTEVEVR
jgi:hypothetical protein